MKNYDVIVIGAGHAGIEAATAAVRILSRRSIAKAGGHVSLFTKSPDDIGAMSCNPSIGGPGKSQLVAEIDALGGIMPRAADAAGIHFRMLNMSNGPATRALRAQIDRDRYREAIKEQLAKSKEHIEIIYSDVEDLDIENKIINGEYQAKAIVIATGTFLNGLVHRGKEKIESGRLQDNGTYQSPDKNISNVLKRTGFRLIRLKTGTPARLYADSIDFSKCEIQPGDENHEWFSAEFTERSVQGANNNDPSTQSGNIVTTHRTKHPANCYITHTTSATHQVIRDNIKYAPLYNGEITGTGPRYCPSLEDKVMRFPEHESHHVFLEPEGVKRQTKNKIPNALRFTPDDIIYPNGLSTSMSAEVQDKFLRTIPGLENVRVARYGYAIEYDVIEALALKSTLESKNCPGLYFAGQINGTSGYEEAAAQGLVAGANAAAYAMGIGNRELRLDRTNSMIGVLIDDITTLGVDEPYRMFTSRTEYRLSLRADNAIFRLGPMAVELGLLSQVQFDRKSKRQRIKSKEIDEIYAGYIARNAREIEAVRRDIGTKIPADFDYGALSGLTNELREKLTRTRPENIAILSRIPGITPAGVALVLHRLRRAN